MDQSWKQDPRVKTMNAEKLKYLTELAVKIEKTPKKQLMPAFMSLTMDIKAKGIQFTDQETDLLVTILSANMSPEDRKKLDTLKMLSKKIGK